MADYQHGPPNGARPSEYGSSSNNQRDAAFSNIFGAAPPPGRSQTMNSSIAPPSGMNPVRTQTMNSQVPGMNGGMHGRMQRQPPPRQQQGGYPPPGGMSNGYHQGPRRPPPGQAPSQPQPQYLPQQVRPDRRPYPSPQRV